VSRFDYKGPVHTKVNNQQKKKRTLDRPKESPVSVGPPKRLVQEQPRTRTYLPNPGQAPVASKAPKAAASGVSNKPRNKPAVQGPPTATQARVPAVPPTRSQVGPRAAQASTPTRTGTGTGMPKVSVSISNETAVGRGLNRIFTGSPNRTVEERKKRWEGIQSRAGNR
jgi:hypothetical protein